MTSEIAVFDLTTDAVSILLRTDAHIEAPNWHPGGDYLIVNGGGRLFRVLLENPALVPIDTGFAIKCNNDHGVSPDGQTLVISDGTEDGARVIYTVPVEGGTPVRVTANPMSYWHGWSPDGGALTYTAKRGDTFQIHTIAVDGGDELKITDGFDHCDGPDYTPDGEWIWFNGERSGAVDLWRIRPDGSDLEQMTADTSVNWFPHPSPDGRHIVYLAYEPGTKGHPANRNVELRLMPATGGAARVLTAFNGGQGTINVPSWAPDSKRFAFVRYA